jgi:hypothetical protein
VNRIDFQKLAELRIEEAEVLLKNKKYSGAYYLAGYAVEFGLKACIAKKTKRHDYPDKDLANKCYTHDVDKLIDLVGLRPMLRADAALLTNWAIVKDWDESARFARKTRAEAQALYDAITDATHGVLPWIRTQW